MAAQQLLGSQGTKLLQLHLGSTRHYKHCHAGKSPRLCNQISHREMVGKINTPQRRLGLAASCSAEATAETLLMQKDSVRSFSYPSLLFPA